MCRIPGAHDSLFDPGGARIVLGAGQFLQRVVQARCRRSGSAFAGTMLQCHTAHLIRTEVVTLPLAVTGSPTRLLASLFDSSCLARWRRDRTVPTGHSRVTAASLYVTSCRSHSTTTSRYRDGSARIACLSCARSPCRDSAAATSSSARGSGRLRAPEPSNATNRRSRKRRRRVWYRAIPYK